MIKNKRMTKKFLITVAMAGTLAIFGGAAITGAANASSYYYTSNNNYNASGTSNFTASGTSYYSESPDDVTAPTVQTVHATAPIADDSTYYTTDDVAPTYRTATVRAVRGRVPTSYYTPGNVSYAPSTGATYYTTADPVYVTADPVYVTDTATPATDWAISPYVSIRGGGGILSIHGYDDNKYAGWTLGGALGMKIPADVVNFRTEAEFAYAQFSKNRNEFVKIGVDTYSLDYRLTNTPKTLMANFYVDFAAHYRVRPYIGAGLGYSWFDQTIGHMKEWYNGSLIATPGSIKQSADGFVWGLYAGLNIGITDNLEADIGARYNRMPSDIYDLTGNVGLRYVF